MNDIPVPPGINIDELWTDTTYHQPSPRERQRAELRSDIQDALTSVSTYSRGLFAGGYSPVIAHRSVVPDNREHWLVGMRRTGDNKKWYYRFPIAHPYFDMTDDYDRREFQMAVTDIERHLNDPKVVVDTSVIDMSSFVVTEL